MYKLVSFRVQQNPFGCIYHFFFNSFPLRGFVQCFYRRPTAKGKVCPPNALIGHRFATLFISQSTNRQEIQSMSRRKSSCCLVVFRTRYNSLTDWLTIWLFVCLSVCLSVSLSWFLSHFFMQTLLVLFYIETSFGISSKYSHMHIKSFLCLFSEINHFALTYFILWHFFRTLYLLLSANISKCS